MRFSYAASTLAVILIVGMRALAVAQPMMGQSPWNQWNGMGPWHMGPGIMMGAAPRHQLAMMSGIPEPYRSMSNPLPRSADTVEFGALVYHQNCASCHGATGRGDGPAVRELSPRPANLAWLSRMPMVEWDPFMYRTIAEGRRAYAALQGRYGQGRHLVGHRLYPSAATASDETEIVSARRDSCRRAVQGEPSLSTKGGF
jgi:hypothetical protein